MSSLDSSLDVTRKKKKKRCARKSCLHCTASFRKLSDHGEVCSQDVANMQGGFKRGLLKDVAEFKVDLKRFRDEWLSKVNPTIHLDFSLPCSLPTSLSLSHSVI